jgi:nucleotide-binding universal stress UspA family protein
MIKLAKILAPVEFSPRCHGAVQYAEALACRFQGGIVLLHVVTPPWASYGSMEGMAYSMAPELARQWHEQRSKDLDEFRCEAPTGRPVERVVMEGDPARAIVDYAAAHHCDLIVMPTHGYGPFRRFLLGSVTAKVLHDAACPVWTGPHMEVAPDYQSIKFERVACAIDLGLHSRDVMCWAWRFAQACAASLTVIHAQPSPIMGIDGLIYDPDLETQMAQAGRERIQSLMQDLGITGDVVIEPGEAALAVRGAAQAAKADVLVIGRDSTPRAHGHLPTNSYAIVRESPCPVVAI